MTSRRMVIIRLKEIKIVAVEDLLYELIEFAKEYANDKEKTQILVNEAIKKAKKKGQLELIWENIQLLF